jgi:CheY-like chemotaxis protein
VAHDFNNILGVVLGHAEALLRKLPPGDENRPRLEQVVTATRRAADLTRQLLAFSRRQVLRAQVVDLNAVVLDTREILERLIGEDIELGTRLEPDLGQVMVDPGQIGQVLMNLALNARDAMPDGGTLAIETANATLDEATPGEPDNLPPGSYVRLRVCDTGTGIDELVRSHIFEPFFTTKAQGLGSGLGLSSVYGIVTQSGGTIQVDSSPGQGTAFTIHLPRLQDAAAVVSAPPVEEAPRGGAETILVVEDQAELRSLICEVLGDAGHTVLAAANGLEALARAESHAGPVHLLLTDVVMPGMNGRELAERLTALRPELRVLFVSGYARDVIAKRGVLEERVDLLEKPFSRANLLRRVRRALDGEPFNPAAPA